MIRLCFLSLLSLPPSAFNLIQSLPISATEGIDSPTCGNPLPNIAEHRLQLFLHDLFLRLGRCLPGTLP